MSGWNPLVDGLPDTWKDFDRSEGGGGWPDGQVEAAIMRNPRCDLLDAGHDFGMVERVDVERDCSLAFHLTCGCIVCLQDALGGGVIKVIDSIGDQDE